MYCIHNALKPESLKTFLLEVMHFYQRFCTFGRCLSVLRNNTQVFNQIYVYF